MSVPSATAALREPIGDTRPCAWPRHTQLRDPFPHLGIAQWGDQIAAASSSTVERLFDRYKSVQAGLQ